MKNLRLPSRSQIYTFSLVSRAHAPAAPTLAASRSDGGKESGHRVTQLWSATVFSAPVASALGFLWMSLAGCGREPAPLNAASPPPPPSGYTGWLMGTAAIVVVALVALPFLYTLWTGQGKNEPAMHSLRRRRMTIMIASAVMATVIVLMMWILIRA